MARITDVMWACMAVGFIWGVLVGCGLTCWFLRRWSPPTQEVDCERIERIVAQGRCRCEGKKP